jgi:photosystem II stability/assembly factor-like uncharacterized protein
MAQHGRVAIVATIATLALAGCASTLALPSAVATTSPTPAPTATPSPTTPSLPIPPGFQPVSLSAISESDFWVLGRAPCATVFGCPSDILHTTNGGRTFQRIPSPVTVYLTGAGPIEPPLVSELRFANASDGWAFGNGPAYVTHDGGTHWYELNPDWTFLQIVPGANGYVYASVEVCTNLSPTTCVESLMRSRADSDDWVTIEMPGTSPGWPSIGVHGDTVWVMYFDSSTALAFVSHDDGTTWDHASMPCEPDLGGLFDPVSTSVVWAFCATGTEGVASVSTNGGMSYTTQEGPVTAFGNGSFVGALSARDAFVAGPGGVELTTNGGVSYQTLARPPAAVWIGFTDSRVGYVISQDENTLASQLWRTTDGGAVWTVISLGGS